MTVAELVDWIDQNYPRLSPYLRVESLRVGVYLDKELRTKDLNIAWVMHRRNGGWRYIGASDIPDPYYRYRYTTTYTIRKNQKIDTFLNKMKLICEGFLKMIDWYEQFPIKDDRAQLIDLGMSNYSEESTSFFKEFPDSGIELQVNLPNIYEPHYTAWLCKQGSEGTEIRGLTLEELLDKIMKGGQ